MNKSKPILFNTSMVQAILDGKKTQTRRVIKPQPEFRGLNGENCSIRKNWDGEWCEHIDKPNWGFQWAKTHKPRCEVGDILWVKVTWTEDVFTGERYYLAGGRCRYGGKPGDEGDCERDYLATAYCDLCEKTRGWIRWKPSIHMPEDAARIFLLVAGVRAERLQDISEEDAIAEGCAAGKGERFLKQGWTACYDFVIPAYYDIAALWDSIYTKKDGGIYAWDKNPWVWVYRFERMEV
ncbi:MAG: hypothetical protein FWG40_00730 [Peptococcaceae bacterium]|nr:hypothetical protein [Peptococcaceae bacterium]